MAVGIIVLGARAVLVAIKGVRDVAAGLIALALLIAGPAHTLGWFLVAASAVPLGGMLIVLRSHGPRVTAYGIHGATAALMLATAAALVLS